MIEAGVTALAPPRASLLLRNADVAACSSGGTVAPQRLLHRENMMRHDRLWQAVLVAMAFVALMAVDARAQAYCIQLGPPVSTTTYVGLGFKVPPPGKCAAWLGFCTGCSPDNVQTGSACTASKGAHVSFVLTTAYLATNRQWDFVRLDLPSQKGSGNMNTFETGFGATISYPATGKACTPPPTP